MTVGLRQRCSISPVQFNIFLKKITQKTLTPQRQSEDDQFADNSEEDEGKDDTSLSSVAIRGRLLCNLQFSDDIDLLQCREEELQQLTERLEKTAAGYGMKISSDKNKILVKPRTSTNIWMNV